MAGIYLDNAASTPVDPRVTDAMCEVLRADNAFGNPAAGLHSYGEFANQLIDKARTQVAALINCAADGVIWTSGATEADNLALLGLARFRGDLQGRHIVTAITEHSAVLNACRQLKHEGFEISFLHPDREGRIAPDAVQRALRDDTILVSLMHVNNETGVIQDIAAVGQICRDCDILLHVDAAQSAGRLPLDVVAQNIDMLSLSAHKMYGPKGVGALYLNTHRVNRLQPLMFGGGQERGMRPGTLPTHQIVGMGLAAELARAALATEPATIAGLREQLWTAISDVPGLIRNSAGTATACGILSVSVAGVEGESLLYALRSLAVASGSACNTASDDASYVLRALGRSDQLAESTIRFSLGRFTTAAEVAAAAAVFRTEVRRLRAYTQRFQDLNKNAI
jgi:cysteine desulfurase